MADTLVMTSAVRIFIFKIAEGDGRHLLKRGSQRPDLFGQL
jgi:hypothetical protein